MQADLVFVKMAVDAVFFGDEFLMSSLLHDSTFFKNQNSVGFANGGQVVGDNESRSPGHQFFQRLGNNFFCFGVQGTRRFI